MVNIGTFVLCAIICVILFGSHGNKALFCRMLALTIVVELMIERGYFIRVGSQQVAYRTICEVVMACVSLGTLISQRVRMDRRNILNLMALIVALVIGWSMLVVFPSEATGATLEMSWDEILVEHIPRQSIRFLPSMFLEIVQVLMFLLIILTCVSYLERRDWAYVMNRVIKGITPILFVCLLEVVTVYVFHSDIFHVISDYVLGNSLSTQTSILGRGSGYVLMGFTKEASHFASAITVLLMMDLVQLFMRRPLALRSDYRRGFRIGVCVGILVLSMSFSSLYFGFCLLVLILLLASERRGRSSLRVLFVLTFAAALVMLFFAMLPYIATQMNGDGFWGRRIKSVAEELDLITSGQWLYASTALEWSNRVRLGSTYETIKLIAYRPLFGLGLASTTAHSSIAMLLSGCGIVGTFLYLRNMFWWKSLELPIRNKGLYASLIVVYLAFTLLNSLSLRPYYECWCIMLVVLFRLACSDEERNARTFDGATGREI